MWFPELHPNSSVTSNFESNSSYHWFALIFRAIALLFYHNMVAKTLKLWATYLAWLIPNAGNPDYYFIWSYLNIELIWGILTIKPLREVTDFMRWEGWNYDIIKMIIMINYELNINWWFINYKPPFFFQNLSRICLKSVKFSLKLNYWEGLLEF